MHNRRSVLPNRCCKDERLVSNGFEIKGRFGSNKYFYFVYILFLFVVLIYVNSVWYFLDGENGKMTISLVKMNATIPYFGISDLVEVIGELSFYGDHTIHLL